MYNLCFLLTDRTNLFLKTLRFARKYHGRVDQVMKRSSILKKMISDRDKKKDWYVNIMAHKPKARNVFEKIHMPHKRQTLLNSVFIKNITDVLSTGDVAPEVLEHSVEISGLRISPCCKILNVFWQIPDRQNKNAEKISEMLNIAAPKIRAELISRNVIGKVPHIFFLRDNTNAKVAAFEEAMKNVRLDEDIDFSIVADDAFTKDIYSFKKVAESDNTDVVKTTKNTDTVSSTTPSKPADMKCDVFGLDQFAMMEKVNVLRKKSKQHPKESAVISPDNIGDLFSKIPGICFQTDSNREDILKRFQVERKMLKQKKNLRTDIHDYCSDNNNDDYYESEEIVHNDFIEE